MFQMSGALHLSEEEVWNTCPRVLVWQYQGLIETQEAPIRAIWESARFEAVTISNSNGAKIRSMKRFVQFPWESQEITLTKTDIERLTKKFKGKIWHSAT